MRKFNKSTLGGCILEKKDGFISVAREKKIKPLYLVNNQ